MLFGRATSAGRAGRRLKRYRSPIGAATRPSICRCQTGTAGGRSFRSGNRRRRRIRSVGGNRRSRTGRVIRDLLPAVTGAETARVGGGYFLVRSISHAAKQRWCKRIRSSLGVVLADVTCSSYSTWSMVMDSRQSRQGRPIPGHSPAYSGSCRGRSLPEGAPGPARGDAVRLASDSVDRQPRHDAPPGAILLARGGALSPFGNVGGRDVWRDPQLVAIDPE